MTVTSQNGWPALHADSPLLTTINIPTREGVVRLRLRGGSAGFLLAHFILWWADRVEPIIGVPVPLPDPLAEALARNKTVQRITPALGALAK